MSRKPNKEATRFSVAVYNDNTLQMLNEIAAKFGNRTTALNEALDIGVPQLYERYFQKEIKAAADGKNELAERSILVDEELSKIRRVIDDLFIEMNAQEVLLAGLYNVKMLELDGRTPTSQALADGSLCELPEFVAGIKEDMTNTGGDQ